MPLMRYARLAVFAVAISTMVVRAEAQKSSAQPADPAPTPGAKGRQHVNDRRLALIVKKMSDDSGHKIECDSSVSNLMVLPPAEDTTAANFETQIDALVTRLPKGSTWAKLYMPDVDNVGYRPDDLADYAMASARLFGNVGGALPPGTIEVLGKKLSADKAASVGGALNLKPIYIIANGSPRRPTAQQRAQALLAMDPDQRSAAIADMMRESADVMKEMFAGMTPEQRQQFSANGQTFKMAVPNGGQATFIIRSKSDGDPPAETP